MWIVRKLWAAISGASTLWGLFPAGWQAAVIAGTTAMSGYLVALKEGLHWAIVGGSVVFAATTAGLYYALLLWRQISVFERLSIERIEIIDAGVVPDAAGRPDKVHHMTIQCRLKNDSDRNIFYKLRREHLSIAGRINQDAGVSGEINVVPPRGHLNVVMPTLKSIDLPKQSGPTPLTGKVELEIEYGAKGSSLSNLFEYSGEPSIGFELDSAERSGVFKIVTAIKRNSHRRI